MTQRSAADDSLRPPLRSPGVFDAGLSVEIQADTILNSRFHSSGMEMADWIRFVTERARTDLGLWMTDANTWAEFVAQFRAASDAVAAALADGRITDGKAVPQPVYIPNAGVLK